jgi:putative ATP-binding cassette transporter
VGGLGVKQDWAKMLSSGEEPLLAFARLLLGNPPFALLDEALSALKPQRCEQLYQTLSHTAISYITVGDHAPLREYHDMVLELHPDGQWNLEPAHRAAAS